VLEIPDGTDYPALIECPSEGAIVVPLVAIPQKFIVLVYRVDYPVATGEHVFEIPD
jgi:hypothetical protein